MNEQRRIVEEAIFQIACAMNHINWLRGTLHVLEDRLKLSGDEHYATVANMAIYNADDWHYQLDCERESLDTRTEKAFAEVEPAPRSAQSESVARESGGAQ